VLTIAIPSWTAGCYKRVEIPREQLTNNATFPAKEGPYFVEPKALGQSTEPLKLFRIENGTLLGDLKNPDHKGQTTYVLNDVRRVDKKEFSGSTTAVAAVFGGVGLIVVFVLGKFALMSLSGLGR
jgi:hypothetical protein